MSRLRRGQAISTASASPRVLPPRTGSRLFAKKARRPAGWTGADTDATACRARAKCTTSALPATSPWRVKVGHGGGLAAVVGLLQHHDVPAAPLEEPEQEEAVGPVGQPVHVQGEEAHSVRGAAPAGQRGCAGARRGATCCPLLPDPAHPRCVPRGRRARPHLECECDWAGPPVPPPPPIPAPQAARLGRCGAAGTPPHEPGRRPRARP